MRMMLTVMLLATLSYAASSAPDSSMVLLHSATGVRWVQAPPSLPRSIKISMIAGDPAQSGLFTLRVLVPSNTVIPPHTPAKLESLTILSGEIYHEMGERLDKSKGSLLKSGGFVSLPPEMAHSLWALEQTVLQVSGTGPFDLRYIEASDDPRNDKTIRATSASSPCKGRWLRRARYGRCC